MSTDLRPLQQALRELRYTAPLTQDEAGLYVARPDRFGDKLLNRLTAPLARRLLLAGPAGSGKSTELLQYNQRAHADYAVIFCPCDRELDLYRLEPAHLFRYVLWKLLAVGENDRFVPTEKIVRDALECLGLQNPTVSDPRHFFATPPEPALLARKKEFAPHVIRGAIPPPIDRTDRRVQEVLTRYLAEVERGLLPVLLIIDGLEKLRDEAFRHVESEFIRSPVLDRCHSLIVAPQWALYGWRSLARDEGIEILEMVAVPSEDFIVELLRRRTQVFEEDALRLIASWSGGIPRDALELATHACRTALDEGVPRVALAHVEQAKREMVRTYTALFSDDPLSVADFLRQVRRNARLPGEPALRDRLLACGALLPQADGSVKIHPLLGDPPIEEQLA